MEAEKLFSKSKVIENQLIHKYHWMVYEVYDKIYLRNPSALKANLLEKYCLNMIESRKYLSGL